MFTIITCFFCDVNLSKFCYLDLLEKQQGQRMIYFKSYICVYHHNATESVPY